MTTMLSCPPTPMLAGISSFNQQQFTSNFIPHLDIYADVKLVQNESKPRPLTS